MSSSIISSLVFAGQQATRYMGIPILVGGVLGGLLNAIVFLSLQTFRQSSCVFYLTIMSIVDIGQLLSGSFSRIMITGFGIDWTHSSLFYCKIRLCLIQTSSLISNTCLCLAILDQYFATCSHPRWQRWSNIKLAHYLTAVLSLVWILHDVPYFIYLNHFTSPNTGETTCITTNSIFLQYRTYFSIPVLVGILPVFITILFGILAYRNVRTIAHRTIPLVRRELDKQLTVMVLSQVLINSCFSLPYVIMNVFTTYTTFTNDSVILAKLQLTTSITILFNYLSSAVSVWISGIPFTKFEYF
jgi:hypothetical protein